MVSLCVYSVVGLLFAHDCLVHDYPLSSMTTRFVCVYGARLYPLVSESLVLVDLFLIDCLSCLGVIPNYLPSTKLGVWSRV